MSACSRDVLCFAGLYGKKRPPQPAPKQLTARSSPPKPVPFIESIDSEVSVRGMLPPMPYTGEMHTPCAVVPGSSDAPWDAPSDEEELYNRQLKDLNDRLDVKDAAQRQTVRLQYALLLLCVQAPTVVAHGGHPSQWRSHGYMYMLAAMFCSLCPPKQVRKCYQWLGIVGASAPPLTLSSPRFR